MRVLIIGCGYVGIPLGNLLAKDGHEVFGMRRSVDADAALKTAGITPIHADISNLPTLASLDPNFDAVINLVSSSKGGVDDYRRAYLEGTRNILAWLSDGPPRSYIHASSTSLYAQTDGSWVTEESETVPNSETSRILLEMENLLGEHERFPIIVLRLSGIYGPGRGHLFQQYLRGEAVMRDDGSSWINMVHVQDAARAIIHVLDHCPDSDAFNVTDDEPVTQRDFFQWLSQKLGRPMPPSAAADPLRKRGLTNKRVSNADLKSTGFEFHYPTFREGYQSEMDRLGIKQDFP